MKFYTYAYLRKDGTPYYVGKGHGSRAFVKQKGGIRVPRDRSRVLFLKTGLSETDAFKHEIYMIAVLGRKDLGTGVLHNRTNGGEGASGRIVSEEERLNKSISTREWRRRMTDEEKIRLGRRISDSKKNRTPEQKAQSIEKRRITLDSRSHEEKERDRQARAERYQRLSEERKREIAEKISSAHQNKTAEEKSLARANCVEAARNREASYTPEQKAETATRKSEAHRGLKWFVNKDGQTTQSRESPGPEWQRGRKWQD